MNLAMLHKFPHWSETLSVLKYANISGDKYVDFLANKKGEIYTDPLGNNHKVYSKGGFNHEDLFICNGSVHLETFPLSVGKIPYSYFPYKIGIEHTSSTVIFDHLAMVDLAKISADDPENAQGSKFIFFMYKKFYDVFMNTNWDNTALSEKCNYYKNDLIPELIDRGYIKVVNIEPTQYWLEIVPHHYSEGRQDDICIVLNWSNFKKASYVQEILKRCVELNKYSGKDIYLKLHSYCKEAFLKYFEPYEFIKILPYESVSKYDVMDRFTTYFVDGTGFGYELSYRAKFFGDNINIFYMEDLPAENNEFAGLLDMYLDGSISTIPQYNYKDFISGKSNSNFNPELINRYFPHVPGSDIPDQCYRILTENTENYFKNLK